MNPSDKKRLRILEDAFLTMANDIAWLKKMGYVVIGSPVVTEVLRHLWK